MPNNLFIDAAVTDIPFASDIFSKNKHSSPNYTDDSFSLTSPEADKLFNEYGVTKWQDRSQFTANNIQYLKQQLEAHKTYKESEQELEEAGMLQSTVAHLGAGALNPLNYALGAGTYKVAGNVLNKLITSEGTALAGLKAVTQGALAAGTDMAIQEGTVENQASAFDVDKFKTVVGVGAIFGGAVGGVAHTLTTAYTPQRSTVLKGMESMVDDSANELLSPAGKFMVDVHGKLLKSKNPLVRDEALKIEHSSIAVGDKQTGQDIVQSWDTAKDIKNHIEGFHQEYMDNLKARQEASGQNIADYTSDEYKQKMLWDYQKEHEASEWINTLSDENKAKIYKEETGIDVTQDTKDLEDVLMHRYYKSIEDKVEIPERIKPLTEFFKKHTDEANLLGTRGIAGKVGTFYSHRMWNTQKIVKMGFDEATNRIVNMMKQHPITAKALKDGVIDDTMLHNQAMGMVQKIQENDINKYFTEHDYIRLAGVGNPTKARVMRVNVAADPDMFVHDAELVTHRYNQKMSGRLALNAIGIDKTPDTHSFADAIQKRLKEIELHGLKIGMSKKDIARDIDNLKVAYDIILNTRQIRHNPDSIGSKVTTALRGATSAIYAGGFVKSAVGELGSVILKTSIPSMLKSFVPAHSMAMQLMKEGDKTLAKELCGMGIGRQLIEGSTFSRLDIEELKSHTTWWERGLNGIRHYSYKWTGFNFVTATSDYIAAHAFLLDMIKASKRGSINKTFLKQLHRYGLSSEDVLNFTKKTNIEYYEGKDVIKKLNIDDWKDQNYAWKIRRAITRMVDDTILRGDGLKMPKYLTDVNSDITMLFSQYQHFPVEAYNRLLLAGMADNPAKLAAGAITSTAIIASVMELENEALFQLGIKKDKLPQDELFKRAFEKSPMASVMPDVYNLARTATGTSDHYTPDIVSKGFGASGYLMQSAWTMYNKIVKGKHLSQSDYDRLFRLTPFSRIPVYGELMRTIVNKGQSK